MSLVHPSDVLVCHKYIIRISFICTSMSSVCLSYVLAPYPYVTRIDSYATRNYSFVICMSLVHLSVIL